MVGGMISVLYWVQASWREVREDNKQQLILQL
jgi:hypothetical protein